MFAQQFWYYWCTKQRILHQLGWWKSICKFRGFCFANWGQDFIGSSFGIAKYGSRTMSTFIQIGINMLNMIWYDTIWWMMILDSSISESLDKFRGLWLPSRHLKTCFWISRRSGAVRTGRSGRGLWWNISWFKTKHLLVKKSHILQWGMLSVVRRLYRVWLLDFWIAFDEPVDTLGHEMHIWIHWFSQNLPNTFSMCPVRSLIAHVRPAYICIYTRRVNIFLYILWPRWKDIFFTHIFCSVYVICESSLSCRSSGDQPGEALSYIAMVAMKDNNRKLMNWCNEM